MKIFIPNRAKEGIGGGFTFTRNFITSLTRVVDYDYQFVDNLKDANIYFIPGATLAEKEEVKSAKELGKKIVLRVDNVPRNSRNRNTGTSKLFNYAQLADVVVYQSQWARLFLKPFLNKEGPVIMNGVDEEIFNKSVEQTTRDGSPQYLYSRYNRDETKRWECAWYEFQKDFFGNHDAHLWIVGKWSPENLEYNFDLFGGAQDRYKFWGIIQDPKEMAKIYRSTDILLAPYYNDACSNVIIEARLCGVPKIVYDDSGGTPEIMAAKEEDLTLRAMSKKYHELLSTL